MSERRGERSMRVWRVRVRVRVGWRVERAAEHTRLVARVEARGLVAHLWEEGVVSACMQP